MKGSSLSVHLGEACRQGPLHGVAIGTAISLDKHTQVAGTHTVTQTMPGSLPGIYALWLSCSFACTAEAC